MYILIRQAVIACYLMLCSMMCGHMKNLDCTINAILEQVLSIQLLTYCILRKLSYIYIVIGGNVVSL